MYKINCGVKPEDGIQVEFDDIQDFYTFDKRRKDKQEEHIIRGYVKSIDGDGSGLKTTSVFLWKNIFKIIKKVIYKSLFMW